MLTGLKSGAIRGQKMFFNAASVILFAIGNPSWRLNEPRLGLKGQGLKRIFHQIRQKLDLAQRLKPAEF